MYGIKIQIRQNPNRIISANGGNNPINVRISKRRHEVIGSCFWIASNPFRSTKCMFAFHYGHAELFFKLLFSTFIAAWELACTTI